MIIDGDSGDVVIDPAPVRSAGRREARDAAAPARPPGRCHDWRDPCETSDGIRIQLHANIERGDDVSMALASGAEGIGLYRSEFLLVGGPPDLGGRG